MINCFFKFFVTILGARDLFKVTSTDDVFDILERLLWDHANKVEYDEQYNINHFLVPVVVVVVFIAVGGVVNVSVIGVFVATASTEAKPLCHRVE